MKTSAIVRIIFLTSGYFVFMAVFAEPSWAVQAHGGAEGLISHEIGHVLFVIGMGFLLFRIHRNHLTGRGWLEFKGFLWLIIAWNFLTFSGHWMNEFIDPNKYNKISGTTHSFTISSFPDAYFYLTRLDHLILVPSFIFLLLALRKWRTH